MIKNHTKLFTFFKKVLMIVVIGSLAFSQLVQAKETKGQVSDYPVKISFGNESLQSSIDKLEKQSNVKFSYNPADLKGYTVTPYKFQNEPLGKILNYLFAKTRLSFKEINNGIIIYDKTGTLKTNLIIDKVPEQAISNQSADITVTGKVSDNNGPLPGVSVKVEHSTTGVVTNTNGN
jgi:hypothetical protein